MIEPIRVLCVFSTLDRGGAESMCMNLYRHIEREKVQFDFVKHTQVVGAFEKEIISLGGRIYDAPQFKAYNILQYRKWWGNFLLHHPEYKIIHGHYFTASKYYFAVCRKMGRITVGHCHTDSYTNPMKKAMIFGTENYCDYRFACSQKAGKLLYPHKTFEVINNAIDCDLYAFNQDLRNEVRAELHIDSNRLVIGTVGTIKEVKNPLGLIEIFRELNRLNPESILLWVGRDGGMQAQAEEKIEEYGLKEKVIFTGSRSDVYRLLQAMDAFILPSFAEGLPVSVIEAQAAGLPCYISQQVTRDVDITGLCTFIPIEVPQKWALALRNCAYVREDTRQMITSAGYDIGATSQKMQDFYLNIIGG